MRHRVLIPRLPAVLGALVLLLLAVATAVPAHAGEGWWGGLDDGEAVSLADVMRGPRDYRQRILTFFCVFHTADGGYKYYPANTAFSEQRHINFSAWPDGAAVWQERTFKHGELPFLYMRRTNAQRVELLRVPLFTRLEVTGTIRDIVRGRPAIEVFSFRPTGHRLGEVVVDDIIKGNAYARAGTPQGYQLAARRYKAALQPDLPPVYDMIVRKLLADTLRKLGFHDEARRYEDGESIGLPELPTPDPGKAMPQPPAFPEDMPQPFGGPETPARKPARPPAGTPAPGHPDGNAPTGPLPPMAGPPTGALPPAPLGPDERAPAGAAQGDLPPPAPSYGGEGANPPRAVPRDTPKRTTPKAAPRKRSGIPPKRTPRLTGVK